MKDCYAVLGVSRDASQEEIKAAFRERALECHPDRADDGERAAAKEEFVRVREAFEVLSDPEARAAYDESGDAEAAAEAAGRPRRRSYAEAWRRTDPEQTISVDRTVLNQVGSLSMNYRTIRRRTSLTVPLFGGLGMLLFIVEPHAIYASGVFLVDLLLCTALGGIYGFIVGNAWGYADLYWNPSESGPA